MESQPLCTDVCVHLKVVNISLRPHHHFVSRDRLSASTARPAVPKQPETQTTHKNRTEKLKKARPPPRRHPPFLSPDVVTATQNHPPLAVAGGADVPQLGLAAGALEAARVPVELHGEEQEAVGDLPPTAGTRPGSRRCTRGLAVHHADVTGARPRLDRHVRGQRSV